MNYGQRLDHAIKLANSSRRLLAQATSLTEQAIGQCIRGKTEFLKVESSARAAAFLHVDHWWLATGEGQPHADTGWPFKLFTRQEFSSLSQQQREDVENALAGAVLRVKIGQPKPPEPEESALSAYARRNVKPRHSPIAAGQPLKKRAA